MNKDRFRWSIWHKGQELDYICGPDKDQVWENFLQMSEQINGRSQSWYYENLGYSVEESSWWRDKHAS